MKSMKLSEFFEFTKPQYIYIQIIPHKSIRNYNSSNIAKAIAKTYRAINHRIRREKYKLFFETNFKISYIIDIKNNNASFYFLVPKVFYNIIVEKIREIWSKATITLLEDDIQPFSDKAELYQLSYKKDDALSLNVDKKSNEPLNSILNVMEIMKDDDRVTIIYNFMPCSQLGWIDKYMQTMTKIKEHKVIEKKQLSCEYIIRTTLVTLISILDSVVQVVNDFTGGSSKDDKQSLYKSILGVLEQQGELSISTKKKKEQTIINSQIAILSESKDNVRKNNNALSVCQAFRVLDEDNELIYKEIKQKGTFDIKKYDFEIEDNIFSTDEISNFIQVPGRSLLRDFKINYIKTLENPVPKNLKQGTKRLGEVTCKGEKHQSYIEDEYNIGNLPLVPVGGQGSGKTTLIGNNVYDCIKANEGVIVIDFIKNCELSESIKKITPTYRLVEIDLSNEKDIQGLGYNEIEVDEDMSTFEKLNLANLQSQQVMSLVDSISIGDPLSSRMRRFLSAAANVVFIQGYSSIKNVVVCLQDYKVREFFISQLDEEVRVHLSDEIAYLQELDEWSRGGKDTEPTKVGTKENKIEHILDRISMLREDFKLKYMYKKDLKDNIDLVECMEQNKVVLIKMRESDFPTKMIKNILVTYWISKIWLSTQIRGKLHEQPSRCNVYVDEVFQAPTSMQILKYILPQCRKFGTKFIFSTQYLEQIEEIFDTLEASGASFMLLRGSTEKDFNHFKGKLEEFEYEDLRDMDKYNSLNIIYYSEGYSSFITKLPKPIYKVIEEVK